MGTWGSGVFQNDTSSDVRTMFRDLVSWGYSPKEATDHVIAEFGDDPDAWLGLAVTQWKFGWLQESVKAKALDVIDSSKVIGERWPKDADAKVARARAKVLAKVRILLESTQPAPRPIPSRKRFKERTDWRLNELVSFQTSLGKSLVFRVCGHYDRYDGQRPILELLDYYADDQPTLEKARGLPARILVEKLSDQYRLNRQLMMHADSERGLPDPNEWVRLGFADPHPADEPQLFSPPISLSWNAADSALRSLLSLSLRPGPGGDDHRRWEVGDVFLYQRAEGKPLLLHFIDRLDLPGLKGAPVVTLLECVGARMPNATDIRPDTLAPRHHAMLPELCLVSVLVHDDEDAVNPLELRRIGSLRQYYDLGPPVPPSFHSVPMLEKLV